MYTYVCNYIGKVWKRQAILLTVLEAEIREEGDQVWRRKPRGIFLPSLSAAVLFGYFTPRMCLCITWVIKHLFPT